ncbi:MAG: hypothetical protein AAF485_02910 [Chloroflexota bacterium]
MTNAKRQVLLVGSMPFDNEEDAMTRALDAVGNELWSLPDGEIGEKSEAYPLGNRAAWVQTIIDFCEQDPDSWEIVNPAVRGETGFPTGYDKEPRLKPKHPPSEMHKHLDLHWLDYFQQNYPIFKQLREERGLPDLKFQVGLPTGLGSAFPMMHPINALRYASAFAKRMAYEVNEMIKIAEPDDLLFQIEVPGELAMAYQLPGFLLDLSLRSILDLVNRIEPKALFGIHICFGDLNNEALLKSKTLDTMVRFSNRLVEKWPQTHELAYVHYPLAEAADPPPLDPVYYEPLRNIKLPAGVRFVAGFVHDKRSEAEHQQILEIIEGIRGQRVDVASSCGLGRRPPDVAETLIGLSHMLTTV